ncbi:alpha/beta fold hydrolase [Planomicrobium sp. Y74]|uniref:alpha/beta fold hydrolase n=1 Tax=Planomicrobium sp. Y74 TaxID=2478977 RepID=UPI000EF4D9EB|nr:alpha/beta fold hydrolase [Planomicrobium sp. Y74]RLQ91336.1 alpha/beta hydrolase [Planomicrobium sp. Y74]
MALNLYLHSDNEKNNDNLIILIHGLGASGSTWNQGETSWIELFLTDESCINSDVAEVTYNTSHLANGVLSQMGLKKIKLGLMKSITIGKGPFTTIKILAQELKREIDSKRIKRYRNVVILGHSMGGLVAVRYLLEELEHNQTHNIKGIITVATPYNGSSFALYSQLIKSINKHAQIPSLEPNSKFLDETIRLWQKHLDIISTDFKFFFGTEDRIVSENSAIHLWLAQNGKTEFLCQETIVLF